MKTTHVMTNVVLAAVIGIFAFSGCGPAKMTTTGFLSDYSRMKKESDMSMGFVDDAALARYSSFIVEPVVVHFHHRAKSIPPMSWQR